VTRTWGWRTSAASRDSLLPATRWSTSTPRRRPGPGANSATTSARWSTPSSRSTTTPSSRRSSPQTFSTSSASWTPSTRIRLGWATRALAPTTARLPEAVRPVRDTRPPDRVVAAFGADGATRCTACPPTENEPGALRNRFSRPVRPATTTSSPSRATTRPAKPEDRWATASPGAASQAGKRAARRSGPSTGPPRMPPRRELDGIAIGRLTIPVVVVSMADGAGQFLCRDLGLRLQGVDRALLSAGHEECRHARLLRRAVQQRRGQLHVPAGADAGHDRELVGGDTGRLRLRPQSQPGHHPLRPAEGHRRTARPVPGDRGAARLAARAGAVPVPAEPEVRPRRARRLPGRPGRGAGPGPVRHGVPPPVVRHRRGPLEAGLGRRGAVRGRHRGAAGHVPLDGRVRLRPSAGARLRREGAGGLGGVVPHRPGRRGRRLLLPQARGQRDRSP